MREEVQGVLAGGDVVRDGQRGGVDEGDHGGDGGGVVGELEDEAGVLGRRLVRGCGWQDSCMGWLTVEAGSGFRRQKLIVLCWRKSA